MKSLSFVILATLSILVLSVSGCDITATLTSQTWQQRFAQFTFHNGSKSPVYTFDRDGMETKVRITGMMCNMKPTILTIYATYPGSDTKPCGSTQAFIEGYGMVNYVILSDGVFMGAKIGVACAAGDCGAARG